MLHDAVLETAGLTESRDFRIVLRELPGKPEDERLVLSVRGAHGILIMGTIEPDWFLSDVQLTSPLGAPMAIPVQPGTPIGRLIVLGTNGAFIEVMRGELTCS